MTPNDIAAEIAFRDKRSLMGQRILCPSCGCRWRVCWHDSGTMLFHERDTQSFEAAIFAHRSIEGSWIEVYSPSDARWWKVVEK